MFVSRVAFLRLFVNVSRQCASSRVGFVLILLITLRLGRIHARLICLRAANSSLPAVVLSVASVFISCCLLCFVGLPRVSHRGASGVVRFACPVSVAGLAWRVGGYFMFCVGSPLSSPSASRLPLPSVVGLAFVSSSPSRPLSVWPAACLSLFLFLVCVCLAPRVSRLTLTLTFWSSR